MKNIFSLWSSCKMYLYKISKRRIKVKNNIRLKINDFSEI